MRKEPKRLELVLSDQLGGKVLPIDAHVFLFAGVKSVPKYKSLISIVAMFALSNTINLYYFHFCGISRCSTSRIKEVTANQTANTAEQSR